MIQTKTGRRSQEQIASVRDVYSGSVFPDLQISTFRNTNRFFPTRTIARGDSVRPLLLREQPLNELNFESGKKSYDLYDYVSLNRITGLLVLKDGEIAMEHYEYGNSGQTKWMSMSMAKSISTTLVGIAIQDGFIDSLDDQLTQYLPELKGGSYDGVTVRQLLRMTSGVRWDETHTDPQSERRHVLELQIAQQPGAILRYMSGLPRVAEPGTRWNYSTGETYVVGALLHAATGCWISDYLSTRLWSKLGMDADADWWLESPDGLEVAGCGISATLHDYGRFGLFILNDGVIDSECMLPEGWVREAAGPFELNGETVPYGYMWWSVPSSSGSYEDGAFSARAIFGQYIYINPKKKVVIVVWSARPKPLGYQVVEDNDFFNAVADTLS